MNGKRWLQILSGCWTLPYSQVFKHTDYYAMLQFLQDLKNFAWTSKLTKGPEVMLKAEQKHSTARMSLPCLVWPLDYALGHPLSPPSYPKWIRSRYNPNLATDVVSEPNWHVCESESVCRIHCSWQFWDHLILFGLEQRVLKSGHLLLQFNFPTSLWLQCYNFAWCVRISRH